MNIKLTAERASRLLQALAPLTTHDSHDPELVAIYDEINLAMELGDAPSDPPAVGHLVVAIIGTGYWGTGHSIEHAIHNARKEGASGVQYASIYIYSGPPDKLKEIAVGGDGSVSYPQGCTIFRAGKVKLSMKQEVKLS